MSFVATQYRNAGVGTASPVEVVVQLYDGALRFLRQAVEAMAAGDVAVKGQKLSRAHAVVSELASTLDESRAPELCAELLGLYDFVLNQIADASVQGDPEPLRSSIRVLGELREAWAELARSRP